MTVELRPLGVNCNIACQYCYQNPQRDAGNLAQQYDMSAMMDTLIKEDKPFAMFGGEPLLVPLVDLETLLAFGHERFGRNTIQTNGALVNEQHLELFEKYNVSVGVSIDGPGELNDVRWAGSLEKTRQATARTLSTIDQLCARQIPVSVIITLHRQNASAERLPYLRAFVRELAQKGVRKARLHVLEVENELIRQRYALTSEENAAALLSFAQLATDLPADYLDVFHDIEHLLRGQDHEVSCVWRACDPYTTAAVQGVEGFGQRTNCGRTNKDGVDFVKAQQSGYERYFALYHTPQMYNGCQGCRFFLMCKGQCPGTAVDGDWRNRTEHCDLWQQLFSHFEAEMVRQGYQPLSLREDLAEIEQEMLRAWAVGKNPTVNVLLQRRQTIAVTEIQVGIPL